MLSDEIKQARGGMITASCAVQLMGGYEAELNPPSRDGLNTAIMLRLRDLYREGERKFLVGTCKPVFEVFDAKCSAESLKPYIDVIKWDARHPPAGLVTYAKSLNVPVLFEDDPDEPPQYESHYMRHGTQYEVDAVALVEKHIDLTLSHTGDQQRFFKSESISGIGCTPDGVAFDDLDIEVVTGAEIKCRMAEHHMAQLEIVDNATLRELDFARYCQVQFSMIVLDCDNWWSASYQPFGREFRHKFSCVRIERDEPFIGVMKSRIELAKQIKAAALETLLALPDHSQEHAA